MRANSRDKSTTVDQIGPGDDDSGRAGLQRSVLETGVTIQQDLSVPVPLLMGESNERLVGECGECLRGIVGCDKRQRGGDHQPTEQL